MHCWSACYKDRTDRARPPRRLRSSTLLILYASDGRTDGRTAINETQWTPPTGLHVAHIRPLAARSIVATSRTADMYIRRCPLSDRRRSFRSCPACDPHRSVKTLVHISGRSYAGPGGVPPLVRRLPHCLPRNEFSECSWTSGIKI